MEYCKGIARARKRQYQDEVYWGKPVPGFGDPGARLLIVGLAPAAHGANRTGRMFTGDGSDGMGAADFLARSLHRCGFATQPTSRHRDDGLELVGAYLTAIARCAPPKNRPTSDEIAACAPFLEREFAALADLRAVVALGRMAFDQILRLFAEPRPGKRRRRPDFKHGKTVALGEHQPTLIASYHPSRQNTQTGKLKPAMLDRVFRQARLLCEAD
jgi:uracil-DNA glycosylase family 4